jgi:hypothetical protein
MSQESRNDELNNEKIIKYSNYKEPTKSTEGNSSNKSILNSSKEEYSIINLALMLSYEKKINNIIENVKKELHDNIEIKNVLELKIKDDNKKGKIIKIYIPDDDKFIVNNDPTGTNQTYIYQP